MGCSELPWLRTSVLHPHHSSRLRQLAVPRERTSLNRNCVQSDLEQGWNHRFVWYCRKSLCSIPGFQACSLRQTQEFWASCQTGISKQTAACLGWCTRKRTGSAASSSWSTASLRCRLLRWNHFFCNRTFQGRSSPCLTCLSCTCWTSAFPLFLHQELEFSPHFRVDFRVDSCMTRLTGMSVEEGFSWLRFRLLF